VKTEVNGNESQMKQMPMSKQRSQHSCRVASSSAGVFASFNLIMVLRFPQQLSWISAPSPGFLSMATQRGNPLSIHDPADHGVTYRASKRTMS